MSTTIQLYFLCATIIFTFLCTNYINIIQYGLDTDSDIQKIFDNRFLTMTLITLVSILWLIILPVVIIDNHTIEGGNY